MILNQLKANLATLGKVVINLLLVYVAFMICRVVFLWENYDLFQDLTFSRLTRMFQGGLAFDTTAILYGNALYIVLALFPLHWKENRKYQKVLQWLFVVVNILMVIINFVDTAYFPYTGRRTTMSVFAEFSHETNLAGIFGIELLHHWYLVILTALMGYGLYKLYRPAQTRLCGSLPTYYISGILILILSIPLCVGGMRGGLKRDIRPITISNANQYVDRPIETGIVLNTPFSLMRTLGKKPFITPDYFSKAEEKEMISLYTPIHMPTDSVPFKKKNVVVMVLESFGKEYFGSLNKELEGGTYKGYTPFLDSLITKSLTFKYSFANGRKSIDGLPSVLSGIPRFVEPFFLTPASLNELTSVGGELKKKGYYTAFFHGATHGSMGFEAYTRTVGYPNYFGREDFNDDTYFDGHWGIWDEPFLQYFANKMNTFKQPFATGIFTLSSHHPFRIPEEYKDVYAEGKLPIYKCIRYSDHALKRFFETASKMPWYKNTIFVLTADHTNQPEHKEYFTDAGRYEVPIIFFTPDGDLSGQRDAIAQQIDIMPTILGYLGYDKPYISFGCDLLHTPADKTFAVNYNNGIYQYFKGDYMMQFDGEKVTAMYAFKTDRMLEHNLVGKVPQQKQMELELKSIIQQYMERMNGNQMVIK